MFTQETFPNTKVTNTLTDGKMKICRFAVDILYGHPPGLILVIVISHCLLILTDN